MTYFWCNIPDGKGGDNGDSSWAACGTHCCLGQHLVLYKEVTNVISSMGAFECLRLTAYMLFLQKMPGFIFRSKTPGGRSCRMP